MALGLVLLLTAGATARADAAAVETAVAALARNATDPFGQKDRERAIARLGRLGGGKAAAALAPICDDPFEHLRDRVVGAWTEMLRGGRAGESLAWLAGEGLKHRSVAVRHGVAVALGEAGGPRAREAVGARLSREKEAQVLGALVAAWVSLGGAVDGAFLEVLEARAADVALAAGDALSAAGRAAEVPGAVRGRLLRHREARGRAAGVLLHQAAGGLSLDDLSLALGDREGLVRMALAESLGRESPGLSWDSGGRSALERLLADSDWRVRAAAIAAAVERWRADAVPLLIERLGREDGRLRLDLLDALGTLTGKEIGLDPDLWRAWWDVQGSLFDPGPRPSGRRGPRPVGDAASGTRTAAFFRLPVLSRHVAFLIDCSGSMRDPAAGADGITKFDLAREALAKTLAGLGEETRFDLFLHRYPSEFPPRPEMTRANGRWLPVTPARARKAIEWMAGQEAKGWGAYYDGLAALLEEDVDTVYFLADGRPSRGRYDRDFRVLAEIARANRFRRVAIHTVLVGTQGIDREFLEALAAVTGGRFTAATKDG